MNHSKKLGFKIPKNYFKNSKKEILENIISNNQKSTSYQQYKFYYLSMAAVFIGTLIFYNFPFNKQKLIKLDSNSPIISTVISGEEITNELIIEFYSESIFLNENNLYE